MNSLIFHILKGNVEMPIDFYNYANSIIYYYYLDFLKKY